MTPLTGVRALLQSLALDSIPAEERRPLIEQGLAACDRLGHAIEGLLADARGRQR